MRGFEVHAILPESLRTKIARMERKRDWDGMGAKAISKATCRAGIAFLAKITATGLPEPRFVSPSPLGGVSFQWNAGRRRLYVSVHWDHGDGCRYRWVKFPDSVEQGQADIETTINKLSQVIAALESGSTDN